MIDDQDYIEKISVEHFAAAPQLMTYSAYDSAESIAPDSDFDDEQTRKNAGFTTVYRGPRGK